MYFQQSIFIEYHATPYKDDFIAYLRKKNLEEMRVESMYRTVGECHYSYAPVFFDYAKFIKVGLDIALQGLNIFDRLNRRVAYFREDHRLPDEVDMGDLLLCLGLASKFHNDRRNIIPIGLTHMVLTNTGFDQFNVRQLARREREICRLLDFKVNFVNPIEVCLIYYSRLMEIYPRLSLHYGKEFRDRLEYVVKRYYNSTQLINAIQRWHYTPEPFPQWSVETDLLITLNIFLHKKSCAPRKT